MAEVEGEHAFLVALVRGLEPTRLDGLRTAAVLSGVLGDHDEAQALAAELRDLADAEADDLQLAVAHLLLGLERLRQDDAAGARPHLEDALAMARVVGHAGLVEYLDRRLAPPEPPRPRPTGDSQDAARL